MKDLILLKWFLIELVDGNDLLTHQLQVHNETAHCVLLIALLTNKFEMLADTHARYIGEA